MSSQRSAARAPYSMLVLALLAGCGGPAPRMYTPDPQVKQFAGKGYLSEEQYSINTVPFSWAHRHYCFDAMLSLPVRASTYPLVIYLPGLGEPRTAGEVWRNAWAQAGYAVLSVQLLEADATAGQLPAARNGDARGVVRDRYGAAAVGERQAALTALLESLAQRRADGDAMLKHVDLSRIALVGYDLGAYAAMVGAGERFSKEALLPGRNGIAAVIALSPYAGFSGPAFDERYAALTLPVLSVTGHGDVDSDGAVSSATIRTAPFQHMPPGDKYLLLLDEAHHALFSGGPPQSQRERSRDEAGDASAVRERPSGDGPAEGGRRRSRPGGGGGEGGEGAAGDGRMANAQWGYGQSVVRSVTTAFLDIYLKNDDFSRDWMRRDARRWLRDTAELTVK